MRGGNLSVAGGVDTRVGAKMHGFDDNFDVLYRCAYQAAFRILGDQEESEDVAQEALARASVRWRRVSEYGEAWVTRAAMNLAFDELRRRHRRRRRPDEPVAKVQVVEDDAGDRLDLLRALRSLPRRQRQIVCLRYIADLPEAAVGELLGCSVGTVKSHASRGVARLRHELIGGSGNDASPG